MNKFFLFCGSFLTLMACSPSGEKGVNSSNDKSVPVISAEIKSPLSAEDSAVNDTNIRVPRKHVVAIDQAFLDLCFPLLPIQEAHQKILLAGWIVDEPASHPGIASRLANDRGITAGKHPKTVERAYKSEISGIPVYLIYANTYYEAGIYGSEEDGDRLATRCTLYDFEPIDYSSADDAVAFIAETIGRENSGAEDRKPKFYGYVWRDIKIGQEDGINVMYYTQKYDQGSEDVSPGSLSAYEQSYRNAIKTEKILK